jgi:uncharacterized membrane protein
LTQGVAVKRDEHAGLLGQQSSPSGLGWLALGGAMALALTGGVLLYRRARKPASSSGTSEALIVERTITIGTSADALYQRLRQPQALAQIVDPFAEVTPLGADRTRWTVSGPLGRRFEWETQVVEARPGELLRWESQAGRPVPNKGTVTFRPANRGTEVVLRIDMNPPGGMLGVALAQRFGVVPDLYAAKALRRFKSLVEAGEIPTTARQPAARGDGRDE